MEREGGCAYGEVRYRLNSDPLFIHCCHCRNCGRPQVRFVRGGTLDDPTGVEPDIHIYTKSKVSWVTLPDSVPAFDVYYDMNALWPAASLARLEAALAS